MMGKGFAYWRATGIKAFIVKARCGRHAYPLRTYRGQGVIPAGHQKTEHAEMVCALKAFNHTLQVTSGFLAFVTFAPLCDKLTIYGFGGPEQAADGH
eukprot:CAMPEP_0197916330 /NCGR_PEP_ID=MMETSP1439-20131203/81797_1 /TAXON_ID=66791 /ORGANISM="Gonyaulax spinifera, Strain CCMP409" /LENGTH=96 /DNA_ID=CAMNT_0043538343 /DNA_START=13 /DNA_END=300 /DNA_ORIENTATION=+